MEETQSGRTEQIILRDLLPFIPAQISLHIWI